MIRLREVCNECAATRSFTFLGILWDVLVRCGGCERGRNRYLIAFPSINND
ncbi:hypothetical protein F2Z85_08785 [Bacteroides fragilis]|uniref:Uncharacterized protein n=2 Tax=Bacteroides fragilis TaxID=817 RepID=D1JV08_BACFG|nr:hypothetical protein HMPREF0101_03809 [Bacteroides fragilis]BAD50608.1 hypothetical protein BF3866 [Bacteroides fragilis YCH46]KAA4767360.1 hypothetical protein F2841_22925 [Bacteroides fragilis]KAA4773883.1 hypothetical protein F3B22_18890 [Bacteroides fragilis]KAA4782476.1 hypothetical protein F3B21_23075 [Bacteroides fragilis]